MVIYTVISNMVLMEPQDLVDYLEEALGRSYHKGEAIVGIILAGMGKDPDFNDTIMHVSGHILKEQVGEQVQPYKEEVYIVPGTRSEG